MGILFCVSSFQIILKVLDFSKLQEGKISKSYINCKALTLEKALEEAL